MKRTLPAVCVMALTTVVVACGDSDGGDSDAVITIEAALVGETPAGADAAVYFDIHSSTDDALVGASSPLADGTSLHTMEPVEGGGIMYPTDRIEVDGGGVTRLAPLDKHVMLEGLGNDLVEGATVAVTLDFDNHPDVDVVVDVVPLADLAELLPTDT